jgi:hypothetical protein
MNNNHHHHHVDPNRTHHTNGTTTEGNGGGGGGIQIEMELSSIIRIVHQFLLEQNLVGTARSLEVESGVKGEIENDVSNKLYSFTLRIRFNVHPPKGFPLFFSLYLRTLFEPRFVFICLS